MKKMLALLVVATVVTSVTGCGCCRRLRDTVCRGAYCGAAAPIVAPPPVVTAPVAPLAISDCGCDAAPIAYDAGCAYPSGVPTTVGFGGVPCESCMGGSYTLPGSGGFSDGVIYDDPGFLSSPTTLPADPGPAPTN